MSKSISLKKVIIYEGELELKTPLLIGSGKDDKADIEIVKDKEGNPYIPASSFAGKIGHLIKLIKQPDNGNDIYSNLWGYARNQGKEEQSKLMFSDIISKTLIKEKSISVRDGIRISLNTGTTEDKAKFNYEILEPGNVFLFKIESSYHNDKEKEEIVQVLKSINELLKKEILYFGANTNNGFGKFQLLKSKFKSYTFETKDDILSWFGIKEKSSDTFATIQPLTLNQNIFSISFTANIDNSLIIGSTDPDIDSDKTHLKSNGQSILSGSSIKGAIRSRAEKILNTMTTNIDAMDRLKENLFGFVEEEITKKKIQGIINKETGIKSLKGKLQVTENTFKKDTYTEELQHRIKIDRFTGGTIDGALFDSMPLFNTSTKENESSTTFEMSIDFTDKKYEIINEKNEPTGKFIEWSNYTKAAAGLLLLVLKDLWTGDLPIGGEKNVGRGRLLGVDATITWDDKKVVLKSKDKEDNSPDVIEGNWEELENFVSELNNLVGKS